MLDIGQLDINTTGTLVDGTEEATEMTDSEEGTTFFDNNSDVVDEGEVERSLEFFFEGSSDGAAVRTTVGTTEGALDGICDGEQDGRDDFFFEEDTGQTVGRTEGNAETVGTKVGEIGWIVGMRLV